MKSLKPFCRYPGGKSRHVQKILQYFDSDIKDYREPFLGGGSVFLAASNRIDNAWLNDVDKGVADMWILVRDDPDEIERLIQKHTPILDHKGKSRKIKKAIELWRQIRDEPGFVPNGYRELFLIKTCFSGVKTGGPTGGMEQKSQWPITARWSPKSTIERVKAVSRILKSCKITNESWESVLDKVKPCSCLFLDPPYLEKGAVCYRHSFGKEEHEKLAETLAVKNCRFLCTLDNHPDIRDIWTKYFPADNLREESWRYSMTAHRDTNRLGQELFISDTQSLELKMKCDGDNEQHKRNKRRRKVSQSYDEQK